jgi:signal transduction histidine kinase
MGALCRDAVEAVRAAHPDATITVETRGDLRGSWDGDRVHQALTNLVLNAHQHATHGVRVTAWEGEDRATIYTEVANDGPAIPEAMQPSLFDPFVRGEAATRHGLGLGLYIAQQIALAHGALCTVDSSAGVTTFTISWPRARVVPDPRG